MLRKKRSVNVLIATATLTLPASAAAAVTVSTSDAPSAPARTIALRSLPTRARYGEPLTVAGGISPASPGQPVALEAEPSPGSTWRQLATTTTAADGSFAVQVRMERSELIRVVSAPSPATPASSSSQGPPAPGASAVQRITVAASLLVPRGPKPVMGGPLRLHGHLLPARAHRAVRLQARAGGRWRTLTSARTGAAGGFILRAGAVQGVRRRLRVVFGGDRMNAAVTRPAGEVTTYQPVVVSWYEDGGTTACGFHATYGVASPSLPCGTRIQFRDGSRTVTAVVDDRGPYVGGRSFDLDQSTAGALGFSGVGMVWAAY